MVAALSQIAAGGADVDAIAHHERIHAPGLFYVFVDLPRRDRVASFAVVPSHVVARHIKREHAAWPLRRSAKGKRHRQNNMRLFRDPRGKWTKWDVLKGMR